MKKQRLTEAQIVSILKQYDGGRDPMELCREFGISKATLYNWRKKYAGMDAAHLKEMKALQDENRAFLAKEVETYMVGLAAILMNRPSSASNPI